MAESTLSMGYVEFQKAVMRFLGYGVDSTKWTVDQIAEVDDIIQSGYRQFLNPPRNDSIPNGYVWSFMTPIATLVTVANDYDYALPDNFGGMNGNMTIEGMYGYPPIQIVHEGKIRALRQQDNTITGVPVIAAVRPITGTGTTGQRMELILYPIPDAIYTLSYPCFVLPNKLTTALPYPLGGMIHAETIMESCLAIAEQNSDDAEGLHKNKFYERLLASIDKDKIMNGVRNYGYNGDGPNCCHECDRTSQVTVNGVYYTGE